VRRWLAALEAVSPAGLTAGVVLLALAYRIVVAILFWDRTVGPMVQGVPFSDARSWDALATEFARGERLDGAWVY
jgi:hypothetical protein